MDEIAGFQEEALDFLHARKSTIYADPMGARKTATSLLWLKECYPSVKRTLIVAPLSVLGHWQRQAERWYPDLEVVRGDGTPKQRAEARRKVLEAGRSEGESAPTALLLHYEAMRGDVEHLLTEWDAVLFDEAHRLKGRNTLVAKAAVRIARRTDRLAALTGTPLVNRADELWSLLRLCDPAKYPSYWRWVHRYFETEIAHYIKSPKPVTLVRGLKEGALEELRAEILPYVLQRPLEYVLPDLPEIEHVHYPIALTPAERRIYDALEKHSWVQAEDGSILQVSNEVSKMTRQRQMASDFASLFDEGAPASKAKATIDLVKDLVASGEQVVVMAAFKSTVYSIVDGLNGAKVKAVSYTGDMDGPDREAAVGGFVFSDTDVLVGTIGALAEGVDGLQEACSNLVMVDRDWTPAKNDQAAGRLHRSGQRNRVLVHHVYAENTIDETVARTCESKEQMIEEVLG